MAEMTERHFHWSFNAFNDWIKNPDGTDSKYMDQPVWISVIGYDNEENALIAAKDIVSRSHYLLVRCDECNTCKYQAATTQYMKTIGDTLK